MQTFIISHPKRALDINFQLGTSQRDIMCKFSFTHAQIGSMCEFSFMHALRGHDVQNFITHALRGHFVRIFVSMHPKGALGATLRCTPQRDFMFRVSSMHASLRH